MHPLANHLIQLQELTLIRDEQKVGGHDDHLERLNASIRAMSVRLPADLHTTFEKLQKRDPIAIIPVAENNCSVCGMKLPISLVQAVKAAAQLHGCPNCSRLLYVPEDPPRRLGDRTRITGPRKIGISRFSSHTLMLPRITGTTPAEAITELVSLMEKEGFVERGERLVETALRREAIVSTAVENGLAFPHARWVEGGGLALALGLSPKGIVFDAPGRRVHMVFFLVIPTAASAFYLKLLAGLATSFSRAPARKALLSQTKPDGMWKTLCRVTRTTIK